MMPLVAVGRYFCVKVKRIAILADTWFCPNEKHQPCSVHYGPCSNSLLDYMFA
jgi:hypothetical protein